jgi:hypothetical protein
VASVWLRIRDRLHSNLTTMRLGEVKSVTMADFNVIKEILDVDIPELRRLGSPLSYPKMFKRGLSEGKKE